MALIENGVAVGTRARCGADVYASSAQTITHGVTTAITFDSENEDTDAFHSTSSNTSRLTVPTGKAGVYYIVGQADWELSALALTYAADVRINGTTYIHSTNRRQTNQSVTEEIEAVVALAAGDYVEMTVFESAGVTDLTCTGKLRMYRVSP